MRTLNNSEWGGGGGAEDFGIMNGQLIYVYVTTNLA